MVHDTASYQILAPARRLTNHIINTKAWLLGIVCAQPFYIHVLGEKQFLPLQVIALGLLLLLALRDSQLTIPESKSWLGYLLIAYLGWIAISAIVSVTHDLFSGEDPKLLYRAMSWVAAGMYMILPCFIGFMFLRSLEDLDQFLDGLVVGALATAVVFIAWYFAVWLTDATQLRHVIGQRTPLVLCLAAMCLLRSNIRPLPFFLALSTLLLPIFLSETRSIVIAMLVVAPLVLYVIWRNRRERLIPTLCSIALAWLIATQLGQALQRFNWILGDQTQIHTAKSTTFLETLQSKSGSGQQLSESEVELMAALQAIPPTASRKEIDKRAAEIEAAYLRYLSSIRSTTSMAAYQKGFREESIMVRLLIWDFLVPELSSHPLKLAVGFGQLGPAYVGSPLISPHGALVSRYSAHNEYLDQAIRSGVIGLVLFVALYATLLAVLTRMAFSNGNLRITPAVLAVGLLTAATYAVFHETVRYPQFSIIFWLITGAIAQISAAPARDTPATPR